MHPLRQFFGQVPLFAVLTDDELNDILRAIQPSALRAGQRLFSQGDAGDCAYVVQTGSVEIFTEAGGKEVPVTTMPSGAVIGELALLDGARRNASARAVEDTQLFRLDKKEFDFLRSNMRPAAFKLIREITRSLCERIRETNDHIGELVAGEQPEAAPAKPAPRHWVARMLTRRNSEASS